MEVVRVTALALGEHVQAGPDLVRAEGLADACAAAQSEDVDLAHGS
jgi:hypothetical protein